MAAQTLLLTGEQIRAARAFARLEQVELARIAGLSLETIKRLERIRGPVVDANVRTLTALANAFETVGIDFETAGASVLVRMTGSRTAPARTGAPASSAMEGPAAATRHRIVYSSVEAPSGALFEKLAEQLAAWRLRNEELGVSSILIAREGRILQSLEGPRGAVRQVYGAISTDPRHVGIRLLLSGPAETRLFTEGLQGGLFASTHELFAGEAGSPARFEPETLSPTAALGLLALAGRLTS